MGGEEFKWHHQHTISYGASKDLILDHTVQPKPMIKALSSGRMVSSGNTSRNPSEEVDDDEDNDDEDNDDDDYYYYDE